MYAKDMQHHAESHFVFLSLRNQKPGAMAPGF